MLCDKHFDEPIIREEGIMLLSIQITFFNPSKWNSLLSASDVIELHHTELGVKPAHCFRFLGWVRRCRSGWEGVWGYPGSVLLRAKCMQRRFERPDYSNGGPGRIGCPGPGSCGSGAGQEICWRMRDRPPWSFVHVCLHLEGREIYRWGGELEDLVYTHVTQSPISYIFLYSSTTKQPNIYF